ncbi:DUF736 family protein [Brucella pseudogrignonensis]|uniref:DUF736 family protein n=1 Tax=Brucella pseudogrignonensis TaxID=419475 RepID=UPI001F2C8F93|nr:DUF736 family protein [Brucella pseudogrignonensis]
MATIGLRHPQGKRLLRRPSAHSYTQRTRHLCSDRTHERKKPLISASLSNRSEVGAAWIKKGQQSGSEYVSVTIDTPRTAASHHRQSRTSRRPGRPGRVRHHLEPPISAS